MLIKLKQSFHRHFCGNYFFINNVSVILFQSLQNDSDNKCIFQHVIAEINITHGWIISLYSRGMMCLFWTFLCLFFVSQNWSHPAINETLYIHLYTSMNTERRLEFIYTERWSWNKNIAPSHNSTKVSLRATGPISQCDMKVVCLAWGLLGVIG